MLARLTTGPRLTYVLGNREFPKRRPSQFRLGNFSMIPVANELDLVWNPPRLPYSCKAVILVVTSHRLHQGGVGVHGSGGYPSILKKYYVLFNSPSFLQYFPLQKLIAMNSH